MLTPHPTWDIKDSSKLTEFLTCPRKYFYRYLLGWTLDIPAHDLHFGQSWHCAREYQLLNGYEDVQGAFNAFMRKYREEFDESTDSLYSPKTPTAVLNALMKYAEERRNDLREFKVLYTEISGTVPVDERRVLYYRLDSIMEQTEDGRILSMDHKSTKKFSKWWREYFHLSIQTGTYTHCLYCMFPIDQVLGVLYDGTAFEFLPRGSKTRPAGYYVSFEQVPAYKTPEQMNSWLWTVNNILDDIEREMDRLYHCKEDEPVMMAFPMNPESCMKYLGCQFHDFCLSWQNPLQRCYETPIGFKQEFWNPAAMETTNKKNLEWRH